MASGHRVGIKKTAISNPESVAVGVDTAAGRKRGNDAVISHSGPGATVWLCSLGSG